MASALRSRCSEQIANLRSISELESTHAQLPVEAFEELYLFADDGIERDEIWAEYPVVPAGDIDTEDLDAVLERETTKRRFTPAFVWQRCIG